MKMNTLVQWHVWFVDIVQVICQTDFTRPKSRPTALLRYPLLDASLPPARTKDRPSLGGVAAFWAAPLLHSYVVSDEEEVKLCMSAPY